MTIELAILTIFICSAISLIGLLPTLQEWSIDRWIKKIKEE